MIVRPVTYVVAQHGLQAGDVVLSVNGEGFSTMVELTAMFGSQKDHVFTCVRLPEVPLVDE